MTLYCEVVELQNKAGLLTKHILPQQSKPSLLLSQLCPIWTAQNSSAALLSLDNDAGNSRKNTIKITVHKSSQEQGTITIKVNGYSSTSNIKIQLSNDNVEGYEINYSVDQYLKEKYLWNDDYKLLTPNFKQAYDAFLRNTLLSMTTNTLDKKRNSNGTYSLFSFIQKLDPDLQSSRSAKEKKT